MMPNRGANLWVREKVGGAAISTSHFVKLGSALIRTCMVRPDYVAGFMGSVSQHFSQDPGLCYCISERNGRPLLLQLGTSASPYSEDLDI